MKSTSENNQTPHNRIKIGASTRLRGVINYANILIKERNERVITLTAIGGSIGKLVSAAEVIRSLIPGLHQVNKIGTISYQSVDTNNIVENQRLYPKFEVDLTLDEPKNKDEGYQAPLGEEQRKALFEQMRNQEKRGRDREGRTNRRGRGRGRGFGGRGRGFGGRGRGFGGRGRGFGGRGRTSRGGTGGRGFRGGRGRGFGGRGFRSRGRGFGGRGNRGGSRGFNRFN